VKIVAVVQARMGSTRLPGKVLLPAAGRPLLERMLDRVRAASSLDEVVVATTRAAADDSIRALAARADVRCVSGSADDLVDRHLQVARETGADAVVKIPSDCPLIDPAVIDEVVGFFRRNHPRYAFVSNLHPPTWPDGNDVEVMRVDVLAETWREARQPFQREHTTPFIWDQPERFTVANVAAAGPDLWSAYRLTLDYVEDYQLIAAVFAGLQRPEGAPFSVAEIVAFLEAHPEIRALNEKHAGSTWTNQYRDQLRTLRPGRVRAPVQEEAKA
jgi:spore coat polysaccharide biosynthesis protein SpsF